MPHINYAIDLTASVYIVYENAVLLVFHKRVKSWLPIGGHIELYQNEDAEESLMREIKEECSLEVALLSPPLPVVPEAEGVKFLPLPAGFDIHLFRDGEPHRHMNLVYFGIASNNRARLAAKEHDELKWFDLKELDNSNWDILPSVKYYAKEALKAASL